MNTYEISVPTVKFSPLFKLLPFASRLINQSRVLQDENPKRQSMCKRGGYNREMVNYHYWFLFDGVSRHDSELA